MSWGSLLALAALVMHRFLASKPLQTAAFRASLVECPCLGYPAHPPERTIAKLDVLSVTW